MVLPSTVSLSLFIPAMLPCGVHRGPVQGLVLCLRNSTTALSGSNVCLVWASLPLMDYTQHNTYSWLALVVVCLQCEVAECELCAVLLWPQPHTGICITCHRMSLHDTWPGLFPGPVCCIKGYILAPV
jgi:hypothetical protein